MDGDLRQMLDLVQRAQSAWDLYASRSRLPEQGGWLPQGHPWDSYNNGSGAPQVRRDPATVSAAWNDLEEALRELSYSAERVCARVTDAPEPARRADDVRTGAYTMHPPHAGRQAA